LVNYAYACKKEGLDQQGVSALTRALEIQPSLVWYFRALAYAEKEGGRLFTEKDPWDR